MTNTLQHFGQFPCMKGAIQVLLLLLVLLKPCGETYGRRVPATSVCEQVCVPTAHILLCSIELTVSS